MCSPNSASVMTRAASTSSEEEVTPPLLALASLNSTTPFSSSCSRASAVKNRLAPSTTYLKRSEPSGVNMKRSTLPELTAAGRPPQGTKKSAVSSGLRWNLLRRSTPFSTTLPSGSVTIWSSTRTTNPPLDSGAAAASYCATLTRRRASDLSCSTSRPAGSNATPPPSITHTVRSWPSRISLLPRSPSGPPVCALVQALPSSSSLRWMPSTYARTELVVMPYTSCGMPPRAVLLPVVNAFQNR
mmetsp:Transcript_20496/g.65652  ORF Transcript_20496/g.65652 Transcript_20496/m.65652 type:complete len:243 (-) Transcript_20496:2164-2892(-)